MLRFAIAVVAIVLLAGCGGPAASPADTPAATTEAPPTAATPVTTTETPTPDPPTTAPTPEAVTKTVVVTKTVTVTVTPTPSPTPTPTPTPEPEPADLVSVDDTTFGRNLSADSDHDGDLGWTLFARIDNDNDVNVTVTLSAVVNYTDPDGNPGQVRLWQKVVTINSESDADVRWTFTHGERLREATETVRVESVEEAY